MHALVDKTKTIRQQLGSLSAVLDERVAEMLRHGIRHHDASKIEAEIRAVAYIK